MSHLWDEIHEQPRALERLLARQDAVRSAVRRLRVAEVHYVLIAARGTSDNAGVYAKYLLGAWNGLPVALAAPALFTLYERPPRMAGALVIGISQSGASPDICAVVEEARRQGAPTLAITNTPGSRLAQAAEEVIDLCAGPERSVPATKTYTAQLLALAMVSALLAGDETRLGALSAVPAAVAETLALNADLSRLAERYCTLGDTTVVGRGYNLATALEVALKIKELTWLGAHPYSAADFRHGPIVVVEQGYPIVVVAPSGRTFDDMRALVDDLAARGADQIIISDREEVLAKARTPLRLPAGIPEWLSPIAAVVPGQLLAVHLAAARGLDPDRPRGLTKVTETR
ncbi:MAG TPA: SIS domain-containing protein [Armatimonadota bacterium]|nr:SIS domain-containing protein [Armatimonadota bacterium]